MCEVESVRFVIDDAVATSTGVEVAKEIFPVAASSVVHDTVAFAAVTPVTEIPEITGEVVSGTADVVNVMSLDVDELVAASFESTRKWYVVEAERPESTTLWLVTSELLSVVVLP